MTTTELLLFHQQICKDCRFIMEQKNHDYSGASGETPFANFQAAEKLEVCPTEQGLLVRILDKIMRLSTFVKYGELKVQNESAQDALKDIINYSILLAAYIKQKEGQ